MAGESYNLIRGRQTVAPLTNQSGAQRVEGDVVVIATGNDDSFTTTTAEGNTGVVGVVAETIVAAAEGRVLVNGYVPTLKVAAATARGNPLKTSTVAGQATPGSAGDAGIFAVALSTTAGAGTVSALLIAPAKALADPGDNIVFSLGDDQDVALLYSDADPNAKSFVAGLPHVTEDALNVPVLVIGDRDVVGVDLGFFDGITLPTIGLIDADRDSYLAIGWLSDDNPYLYPGGAASKIHLKQFVSIHDGTEPAWGHSPTGLGVEGTSEFDGDVYLDAVVYLDEIRAPVDNIVEFRKTDGSSGFQVTLGNPNQISGTGVWGFGMADDVPLIFGAADAGFFWETADADAHALHLFIGNRRVLVIGDGSVDPSANLNVGLFDTQNQPLFAFIDATGRIQASTSGTHDGVDLDELTETDAFTNAGVGDIVRITAGTNVTIGWYWITTKTDNSNVDLDRDFVTGPNGQNDVAYVVYDSTAWIGAEGLKLKTFDGAPGDGDFAIDLDGWLALDVGQADGRLYWRANSAWHYVNATAGAEINAKETVCPQCAQEMLVGQRVILVLDKRLSDGALHGHWEHLACASEN